MIKVDSKEKLEEALSKVGIVGEWVNPDKSGFTRFYKFNACGTKVIIEWYWNYSEISINDNVRMYFTHINTYCGFSMPGEWIEFTFKGEKPLHLKVRE